MEFIRDRYLAGVAEAEAQYENAMGDEDSLTGALGALIAISRPREFLVGSNRAVVAINYRKLRGRGKGAPEHLLGPDGIFQIQIAVDGKPDFRKGLPFQAKKNWKGRDRKLFDQAQGMQRTLGGGIVIDDTPRGYIACDIDRVIAARGNRKKVMADGSIHQLGQVLAHDCLDCRVGKEGLYYENQGERFVINHPDRGLNVVNTSVSIVAPNKDREG